MHYSITGKSVSGYRTLDTIKEDGCRKDEDCPQNHYCQPSSSGFRSFLNRFKSKTFEFKEDGKCVSKGILYTGQDFKNLVSSFYMRIQMYILKYLS